MWKLLSPDPFNDMRSQLQWMQIPEHNQALAFSLVSAATQQEPVFEFVWSDHGTEFRANLWNTAPLLSFCAQNGILDLLPLARALADKTFPGMVECDFEVQNDPESELAWVLLTVRTTGSPQEILRAYDAFARQWIGAVSSQKQGMLRLAYDVI